MWENLLNALLMKNVFRFEIAGTTRDTIEDELVIGGIGLDFRYRRNSKRKMS
jgi:tRNA U34 5-carboxymethylaminomethyl modifying GTPase MnmE/TrmE